MDKAQSFAMQYGYYDKGKKKACCVGYNDGYKQAEKALALTPEDISLIADMLTEVSNSIAVGDLPKMNRQVFYRAVLNRYNNIKMKIDKL